MTEIFKSMTTSMSMPLPRPGDFSIGGTCCRTIYFIDSSFEMDVSVWKCKQNEKSSFCFLLHHFARTRTTSPCHTLPVT